MTSWLQTLAEVAVAMAGFSAIIMAFAQRGGRVQPVMAHRLFSIVSISLLVAFLTILPEIAHELGVDVSDSLRLSALFAVVGQTLLFREMMLKVRRIPDLRAQISRLGLIAAYTFMGIGLLTGLACLSGWSGGRETALYLAMLTALLGVAATRFIGFTAVLSRQAQQSDEE